MNPAKIDCSCLPEDYREIQNPPLGIEVSSFNHPASLFIETKENHLVVRIGIKGGSADDRKKFYKLLAIVTIGCRLECYSTIAI